MGVQIPSGRPKLKAPFMGAFSFGLPRIRRDLKPTVKKEAARKQPNNE
ncbi:hypothetical protein [Ruminococcus bromii]